MQLVHHSFRVGPVFLIEFPVSLHGPVEKVDDDLVDFDAFFLILSRHGQDFILGAVAQLTLPQSHQILGEHFGAPRNGCVVFKNLFRRISNGDPVIHLPRGTGNPFRVVFSETHAADGGIVPEKTVAQRGDGEGDGNLGVALGKLQHTAFQIQTILLILPHAEEFFLLIALKFHIQGILIAADHAFPLAVYQF